MRGRLCQCDLHGREHLGGLRTDDRSLPVDHKARHHAADARLIGAQGRRHRAGNRHQRLRHPARRAMASKVERSPSSRPPGKREQRRRKTLGWPGTCDELHPLQQAMGIGGVGHAPNAREIERLTNRQAASMTWAWRMRTASSLPRRWR
jgi:hypothetical protein